MKKKTALVTAAVMLITAAGQLGISAEEQLLPQYTEVLSTVLDWNFDTDNVSVEQDKNNTTAWFKVGSNYAMDGTSKITGDIGKRDTSNAIDLFTTGIANKDNKRSLRLLTGDTTAKVQCNGMWSKITYDAALKNYAVYEMDIATPDFNALRQVMSTKHNIGWGPSFRITSEGKLVFDSAEMSIELNKWYNIKQIYDFGNKRVIAVVDGEIFGTFSLADGVTSVERFTIDNSTGKATTTYVDNIKVYSMREDLREPSFEVVQKTTAAVPMGYKTAFTSKVKYYDTAKYIKVSTSSDGLKYSDTQTYAADTESFSVDVPYAITYINIALEDKDENVLAEHNFTVNAIAYEGLSVKHNIDFEKAELDARSSTRFALYNNGSEVKNGTSSWAINTGSSESTVTIENSPAIENGKNGKALKLTTGNTSDTVQTNEFYTQFSSGWVFYELDFATETLDGSQVPIQLNREGGWQAVLKVLATGKFIFENKYEYPCEINRWYNIKYAVNLDDNIAYCFIDDNFVGSVTLSNYGALVRYTTQLGGAVGSVWVDNIKISSAQNLPEIKSIAAESNTVEIALNRQIDINTDMITLCSGGNYLTPVSAVYSEENTNTIVVTTLEKVFTGSDIDVTINYTSEDFGEKLLSGKVSVPVSEFDVKSVAFAGVNPTVVLVNTSGNKKYATMVMVEKDSNGKVIGVQVSENTEILKESTIPQLTASANAASTEVFFVNDFTDCLAVKNMVYMSHPQGKPRKLTETASSAAAFTAEFDEADKSIEIYIANKTSNGSPISVHLTKPETVITEKNPPYASVLYLADNNGGISASLSLPDGLDAGKYRLYVGMEGQQSGAEYIDLMIYSTESDGFLQILGKLNDATSKQIEEIITNPEEAVKVGIDATAVKYSGEVASNIAALKGNGMTAKDFVRIYAYSTAVAMINNGEAADGVMQSYASAFKTDYASYSALPEAVRAEMTNVIKNAGIENGMYTAKELENIAKLRICKTTGEVQTLIEAAAADFGIDFTGDYANVPVNDRSSIYAALFNQKNTLYTYKQVKSVFDEKVSELQPGKDSGYGSGGGGGGSSSSSSDIIKVETPAASENVFVYSDVLGHFAEAAIKTLSENDIINGYEDNTFRPDNKITRAEMCRLIAAMTNMASNGTADFADVDRTAWYAGYVDILATNGIIFGDGGFFRPNDKITRQDTAVIIARLIEKEGIALEGEYSFADDADISDYARDSISRLAANGYLKGDGHNFYPKNEITRAEAAVLLCAVYTEYFGG